jgi:hypothetical protein
MATTASGTKRHIDGVAGGGKPGKYSRLWPPGDTTRKLLSPLPGTNLQNDSVIEFVLAAGPNEMVR